MSGDSCCSPRPTRIPALPFCHAHLKGPRPLPPSYPQVLATIGDHLRKRRLDLGLLQRELADSLGVTESTVTNWELNRTTPALRFLPRIITLLGFDPRPAGTTLAAELMSYRTGRGLSQEAAARLLAIDPGTLSRWERATRRPSQALLDRLQALLRTPSPQGLALARPDLP
jgi:transcriptional regulator with XRE-family HTH domain